VTRSHIRSRAKPVMKVLTVFVVTYVASMTVVFFWGANTVERYVNLWTARSAAWALSLLGANGSAHADVVESSVSTIRIVSECTALYPTVIFVSAVVAFPSSWRHKTWAAIGVPALVVMNLLRIVSLCYIDHWYPRSMETAHYVVWQSLMIFFTVVLWLLWAAQSGSSHEPSPT